MTKEIRYPRMNGIPHNWAAGQAEAAAVKPERQETLRDLALLVLEDASDETLKKLVGKLSDEQKEILKEYYCGDMKYLNRDLTDTLQYMSHRYFDTCVKDNDEYWKKKDAEEVSKPS